VRSKRGVSRYGHCVAERSRGVRSLSCTSTGVALPFLLFCGVYENTSFNDMMSEVNDEVIFCGTFVQPDQNTVQKQ
jgi:hypothetical protein